MSGIRTLADELREAIKGSGNVEDKPLSKPKSHGPPEKERNAKTRKKSEDASLDELFAKLAAYQLTGKEKLLIRLDDRTVFLLKQLKIAKSIDMNKLIAYALQCFLREHPQLIQYVKDNIKTIEL